MSREPPPDGSRLDKAREAAAMLRGAVHQEIETAGVRTSVRRRSGCCCPPNVASTTLANKSEPGSSRGCPARDLCHVMCSHIVLWPASAPTSAPEGCGRHGWRTYSVRSMPHRLFKSQAVSAGAVRCGDEALVFNLVHGRPICRASRHHLRFEGSLFCNVRRSRRTRQPG